MNGAQGLVLAVAVPLLLAAVASDARGGNFVILREGTPVVVKLTADFDPRTPEAGDTVPLAVAAKVTHEGHVLIEAGAPVAAVFTPGGTTADGAGLFTIAGVQGADGQDVALRPTAEVPEPAGENGGAGTEPAGVKAGNERIPAGTTFRVYVAETAFIEE